MPRWNKNLTFEKDPSDVIDFPVDFTQFLQTDTILSRTVTVEDVTLDSSTLSGNVVTCWISGGTAGTTGVVTINIVTNNAVPRTIERSFKVDVLNL